MTKILFMGTPDFSATVLKGLISDERYEILAVVTQPDRAVGRKKEIRMTPVKEAALEAGLPIYQPEKLSGSPELEDLLALGADGDCHSSLWTVFAESFVRGDEVFCQRARFSSSKIPWWSAYSLCHHEWG